MTSHEYAAKLKALAEALESKAEFILPDYQDNYVLHHGLESFSYYDRKDDFLSAVKAVGSGVKRVSNSGDSLEFLALSGMLRLTVYRTSVCRLVQEAKYECDPLLTPEEEANLVSTTLSVERNEETT
jgi:hypothetical protein